MIHLLALLPSALAVAPTATEGHEPVRMFAAHGQAQAAFQRQQPWQTFADGEGKGWTVQADEFTGTPHRMWGTGIDLGPVKTETQVSDALEGFMDRHAELLGLVHDRSLRNLAYDVDVHTWFADYDIHLEGVPVWRGGLTFRIKHGNLVLVGADTYPHTPTQGRFVHASPILSAISQGLAPSAAHEDPEMRPVWLPQLEDGELVLRAAFEVRTSTHSPRGEWVSFVDGETGALLHTYNEVRHIAGTITAEHDVRGPGSGVAVSPLEGAIVASADEAVATASDGTYSLTANQGVEAYLTGDRLDITDVLGDAVVPVPASGNVLWTEAEASLPAIDTYVFTQQVRSVYQQVVPNQYWTYGDTSITVNIDEACNAFFDGSLNFFRAGSGCSNTGRLADVVYHEWGHGLHAFSIESGFFDGAVSEGVGDTVSFLMTGDSRLAPGFFTNGGVLRNADNTRRYPEDVSGEVHQDGMIFAGAMWDSVQAIDAAGGNGTAEGQRILAGLVKGGPGLEGALSEALVADDDDGDLGNGTPNECEILSGFAAHGLAFPGSGALVAGHGPLSRVDALTPARVEVSILGPTQCLGELSSSPVLSWRANGGPWQELELDTDGFEVSGDIPAQPDGTFVEYTISVPTSTGELSAPTQGWRNPYSFYVGDVLPVYCEDFEADNGGYTHELIAGEFSEGANDWQYGPPLGQGGDPDHAASGNRVWGNDLGREDFNGEYQNDKHNRLTSVPIALDHYSDTFLQYQRWLTVEDGIYDTAAILANGEEVWNNVDGSGSDHHREDQWVSHSVPLGNPSETVEIAWEIRSDAGLTMGGWTLDDVCVFAPATPNNRLGVTDFTATEGEAGGITLAWTQPQHAPLAEVRVVRSVSGCPSSVDDGEVVFYDDAPELSASASFFDPTPTTDTYCYGVFPGDGTDHLGFATEGWNLASAAAGSEATQAEIDAAQEANGVAQFNEENGIVEGKGCGCNGAGGLGLTGWMLGMALLARRARTR